MKFELKTDNENYSELFLHFFRVFFLIAIIIILCDGVLKLGIISRHYHIEHNCNLLSVEKSKPNFKKLSKLSNLKSKQRILEFCRAIIK